MRSCPKNGAGDSERRSPSLGFKAFTAANGAPHISHSNRDGWFTNVHRGHATEEPASASTDWLPLTGVSAGCGGLATTGSRFVAADIAALRIVASGGLIPHAKHGGIFVDAVAVVASKFDGTGFENEQIEQIHVALTGWGDAGFAPRSCASDGCTLAGCRFEACGIDGLVASVLAGLSSLFFAGLGCRMIFGDDFKKPAYITYQLAFLQSGYNPSITLVSYLIVRSIDLFQIYPHRVLPWLVHSDIADPMGGQVGMTILIVGDLVFPAPSISTVQ